jgi:hypothetical protein
MVEEDEATSRISAAVTNKTEEVNTITTTRCNIKTE